MTQAVPPRMEATAAPLLSALKVVDYDHGSGEILRTITLPDPRDANILYPGCLYLPLDTDTSDVRRYVDLEARVVVDKPTHPIVIDGLTLKGVSKGAKLTIEGETYECDGSDVHLEFSHVGTYTVTVKNWPYLDWSAEIENPA